MFTGIVEERGRVRSVTRHGAGARIEIEASTVLEDLKTGDSVAVNGCCLTVVETGEGTWSADVVPETLARTNLAALRAGDEVNLERSLPVGGRFGGHVVQGHVDGTGTVVARTGFEDGSSTLRVSAPAELMGYVVEKGSIAVDGVSLTVASVGGSEFSVAVVPHTARVTTLGHKPVGATVNLEVDILAKYVERILHLRDAEA